MNKVKYIVGLLGFIWITSCSIETEPYDIITEDVYPENEGQVEASVLAPYAETAHLLDDWGWWLYAQEVSSDVLVFPQRGTDWEDGGKWRVLNRHTWVENDQVVQNMWEHLYIGITRCNQAIELVAVGVVSETVLKAIAELEVLRSFYFYLLIDNYGPVPYVDGFIDADQYPYRNKREDIYNELVNVVTEALPLLPSASETVKYRVSKEMAYMLLGKLYLNGKVYKGESDFSQADMDSVIVYMNKVIASPHTFEKDRLAPFSADNADISENIWSVICDESFDDGLRINFRTLHTLHNQTFDLTSSPWNGCAIKPDFYEILFAANDGYDDADDITTMNDEIVDQRSNAFLRGQQFDKAGDPLSDDNGDLILTENIKADVMNDGADGGALTRFSGYRVVKFEVEEGSGPIMNNDFPVFRFADANLMRAEASLRGGIGSDATADEDLNLIRDLAGLPAVTASINEVLNERGRELFLEGHRRSDLIRFGKFSDRDWWLGATTSDPGIHRLVFPVPQSQSDINPNLLEDPKPLN